MSVPSAVEDQFDYVISADRRLITIPLRELWDARALIFFLAWRDLKLRYTQAVIGAGWSVIKPILMLLMFVLVFGQFLRIPTGDIPYAIFVYTGLLPWTLFSTVISIVSVSLIMNSSLLTKIYFPRLVAPLGASVSPIIDFIISMPILVGFMLVFKVPVTPNLVVVPFLMVLTYVIALGFGLWTASLHVRYHDVGQLLPIVLQFWMYMSPVLYPISLVPEQWQMWYSLNPLVGVIQGFRWALLGDVSPSPVMLVVSGVAALVLLLSGIVYFQYTQDTFADVV